jgi:hypothetical protein
MHISSNDFSVEPYHFTAMFTAMRGTAPRPLP